jgi:hypothetical protein
MGFSSWLSSIDGRGLTLPVGISEEEAVSHEPWAMGFVEAAGRNIRIAQEEWRIWRGFEGGNTLISCGCKGLNSRPSSKGDKTDF